MKSGIGLKMRTLLNGQVERGALILNGFARVGSQKLALGHRFSLRPIWVGGRPDGRTDAEASHPGGRQSGAGDANKGAAE